MLLSILSLVVIVLIVRGIVRAVKNFWHWLGRGKELDHVLKNGRLTPEAAEEIKAANDYSLSRRTARSVLLEAPHLTRKQRIAINHAVRQEREEFLDAMHIGWFQIVFIFLFGAVGGLILEEVWMLVSVGVYQSRVGLVWGPFSPLYGFGAVLLTIVSFALRKKQATWWQIFLVSAAIGTCLEQLTGWSMNTLFHAQSWTYWGLPDAITQWIAWRFIFAWGLIGLMWCKLVMPELLFKIGLYTTKRQKIFVVILVIYLVFDVFMTLACFNRKANRDAGLPATTNFERWIDTNFTDEFIANRFQNLVVGQQLDPNH